LRIFYLHGFASDPASHKAAWFAERLAHYGLGLVVPDLNEGDFERLTLTRQIAVVQREIDRRPGPVTLIGSSFGGYLAALVAQRCARVERLALLAPAFRFENLFTRMLDREQLTAWQRDGWLRLPEEVDAGCRRLHYAVVEDATSHDATPLARQLPARIFHGIDDATVSYTVSIDYLHANRAAQLVLLADEHSLHDSMPVIWEHLVSFLGFVEVR